MTPKVIGQNIFNKAQSHLGEAETPPGSNWSERIKIYLGYVGLEAPDAWCAAFASWCVGLTLQGMHITPKSICRTASSHEAVNFGLRNHTIQTAASCVTGDLCILKGGDGEKADNGLSYHHTTLVNYTDKDGTCYWLGGNTNNKVATGSSEAGTYTLLRPYILS